MFLAESVLLCAIVHLVDSFPQKRVFTSMNGFHSKCGLQRRQQVRLYAVTTSL
ncbi:hypothetical protein M758_11G029600 [Ceratodon purpureus]|nr:hypothetical protein M758_11G029600 [Ceratodon purpureus]